MKKLWVILTIAILLRIVLSLTTFHSDMEVFNLAGKLVASGNILNLYDFTSDSAVFNYPPAVYLFHGVFKFIFNIFGLSQITQFNFPLLLLKIPYLIFDLLIGFILLKLFGSTKKGILAFILWMFNPINLYATYMMGQFDIIPTFFIVLSAYFVLKNKLNWAAFSLGFGIAFKLFPIFLAVPLIIYGKDIREKLKLFFLSLAPYLLLVFPYLPSHSFRATALFANQSSKSFYANIPVSGGESIILFPVFLLFFYLIILSIKVKMDVWKLYAIPLLSFFIFTHFHPQWLIWITPFLIMDLVMFEFKNLIASIIIFLTWFLSLFFFDPSLTVGIFAPVAPLLHNLPSIWVLLKINIDYNLARSFIQTAFAASALLLIYQYFPNKKDE